MSNVFQKALIEATTQDITSESFTVFAKGDATITCFGLINDETVTFQIYCPAKKTYEDCNVNGSKIQLSAKTNYSDVFLTVGTYKVKKSVTANPIGVGITSNVSMA